MNIVISMIIVLSYYENIKIVYINNNYHYVECKQFHKEQYNVPFPFDVSGRYRGEQGAVERGNRG